MPRNGVIYVFSEGLGSSAKPAEGMDACSGPRSRAGSPPSAGTYRGVTVGCELWILLRMLRTALGFLCMLYPEGRSLMAHIEVSQDTKERVAFAARMANIPEGEIVRRLITDFAVAEDAVSSPKTGAGDGIPIYADYAGHRTRAQFIAPARVEIVDGPLEGKSYKSPTAAARAVVSQYKPEVNDNRNGWMFWAIDNGASPRAWLQTIRPK